MRVLNSRRGSVLVESAILFPILLVLVFGVIWMAMDFFTDTVDEARQDNAVFREGFEESAGIRNAALIGDLIHEITE